jgi:uncharacterized membrane protein
MRLAPPRFRRAFLTGLVVLIPVAVTFWVMWFVVRTVDHWISPWFARTPWLKDNLPSAAGTALGVLVVVLLITFVGAVANSLFGRAVLGGFDRLVARLPLLRGIYSATKELSSVLFADRSRAFRKVVLFEYPRKGSWSLGFVTNELPTGESGGVYNVFLPTTPNPTSGYFLMIPMEDAIQLEISVEEGLKMVVSGGAVVSELGRLLVLEKIYSDRFLHSSPPEA